MGLQARRQYGQKGRLRDLVSLTFGLDTEAVSAASFSFLSQPRLRCLKATAIETPLLFSRSPPSRLYQCTSVPACFSQGGRSGFGCVSPAFRPRFACEWNAELTISKRVIGIFRLRFACLQNSPFRKSFYGRDAETQGKRVCKKTGNRYRMPAFSGSKAHSLTVMFLPAFLRVSAVKLFIELSKSARNKRAKRPASDEVNPDRRSNKYQLTRNSQLSAFGLTFQICEKYEGHEIEIALFWLHQLQDRCTVNDCS